MRVLVDGTALPDEEARALWQRFSDWMEANKGDLGGFARQEGFASAHPGVSGGRPVLYLSRHDAQAPYAPVRSDGAPQKARSIPGGGSVGRQAPTKHPRETAPSRPQSPKKPGR